MSLALHSIGLNLLNRHFRLVDGDRCLGQAHFCRASDTQGKWVISGDVNYCAHVSAGTGGTLPSLVVPLPANLFAEIGVDENTIRHGEHSFRLVRISASRYTLIKEDSNIGDFRAGFLWRKFNYEGAVIGDSTLEVFCLILVATICHRHYAMVD